MNNHLLSMADLMPKDVHAILDFAEVTELPPVLVGKGAALIFEHLSARTRNASEMAVFGLGGHPITIRGEEIGIDRRESAEDVALTLSGYHALIGARVTDHQTLVRMAGAIDGAGRSIPVINLLSNREHPSQALADLLTIRQHFGALSGLTISFIGDANNVARSLAIGCALVGASFRIASPAGYAFDDADLALVRSLGGSITQSNDAKEVAKDADVLYTDVWISMGEESQAGEKRAAFANFVIDDGLVASAAENAIVMHCLPVHRGDEVTAAVIDGPRSQIWRQAENRMHSLRGLIYHLITQADRR
jgi:ornithine carbamoyltransferase